MGFEPTTLRDLVACSNHLSYWRLYGEQGPICGWMFADLFHWEYSDLKNALFWCTLFEFQSILLKSTNWGHYSYYQGCQQLAHVFKSVGSFSNNGRRRLQKCHLKNEVALLQTLSRLFHLVQFVKYWQFWGEFNSKRLYRSSGREK